MDGSLLRGSCTPGEGCEWGREGGEERGEAGWEGVSAKSPLTPLAVGGVCGDLPCCLAFGNVYQSLLQSTKLLPVFPQISHFHLLRFTWNIWDLVERAVWKNKKKWERVRRGRGREVSVGGYGPSDGQCAAAMRAVYIHFNITVLHELNT